MPTKKPTGKMPTRKNPYREKWPHGKMPTGKYAHKENAYREKCPQGKMATRKNAHMYNSFKIVTGMSAFVKKTSNAKGNITKSKKLKKQSEQWLKKQWVTKKRTMKRRNNEIYNACSNYFVISWRFLFMLVTCGCISKWSILLLCIRFGLFTSNYLLKKKKRYIGHLRLPVSQTLSSHTHAFNCCKPSIILQ